MIVAVDTNVLLDILRPNPEHVEAAIRALDDALAQDAVVICEIVYAELAANFSAASQLSDFLDARAARQGTRAQTSRTCGVRLRYSI